MTGARAPNLLRSATLAALCAAVAGCIASGDRPGSAGPAAAAAPGAPLLERDVEAPEIFRAADEALWDGRPSLGGIWVAAIDVRDPERVIMRNPGNGRSVVGALFRRERVTPGPTLQLSSEAAVALGILAGMPTRIEVIALREAAPVAVTPALEASGATVPDATDAGVAAEAAPGPARRFANPLRRLLRRGPPAPIAVPVPIADPVPVPVPVQRPTTGAPV